MSGKLLGKTIMDKGLEYFEGSGNTIQVMVIKNWDGTDNYSNLIAGDLGSAVVDGTYFDAIKDNSGGRRLTTQPISVNCSAGSPAGHDLHVALVDQTNGLVLSVFEEQTDQALTLNNPIDIPVLTIDINQPV